MEVTQEDTRSLHYGVNQLGHALAFLHIKLSYNS